VSAALKQRKQVLETPSQPIRREDKKVARIEFDQLLERTRELTYVKSEKAALIIKEWIDKK
jgi:hypothetical protein